MAAARCTGGGIEGVNIFLGYSLSLSDVTPAMDVLWMYVYIYEEQVRSAGNARGHFHGDPFGDGEPQCGH